MSAPRKFDEETRARAVRLYAELPEGPVLLNGPEQRLLTMELTQRLGTMLQPLTSRQRQVLIRGIAAGRTQRRGDGQRTRLRPDRRTSRSAPRPQSAPRHRLESQPQRRCRRRERDQRRRYWRPGRGALPD
jgi:hypothetical protein